MFKHIDKWGCLMGGGGGGLGGASGKDPHIVGIKL